MMKFNIRDGNKNYRDWCTTFKAKTGGVKMIDRFLICEPSHASAESFKNVAPLLAVESQHFCTVELWKMCAMCCRRNHYGSIITGVNLDIEANADIVRSQNAPTPSNVKDILIKEYKYRSSTKTMFLS
ncbi:hypothetical protein AVEN_47749-1 [Araneus ventricosus]|uniref:Uncharacterized protein n=1 Tax=Araneus ventricosus TaxID=182803 RepID=A0A4Y2K237_ARAVE|nr:hypothetical protein AVEN_47749-1 [Araneus ventricosus]